MFFEFILYEHWLLLLLLWMVSYFLKSLVIVTRWMGSGGLSLRWQLQIVNPKFFHRWNFNEESNFQNLSTDEMIIKSKRSLWKRFHFYKFTLNISFHFNRSLISSRDSFSQQWANSLHATQSLERHKNLIKIKFQL